jgi:hypothetical protein
MSPLLAQATPQITQTFLDKWFEPASIIGVLSILTAVLFFTCGYLLRLYIKERDKTQELLLAQQKQHDIEQKELNQALLTALRDSTTAVTEISTIVKRLDQWMSSVIQKLDTK